MPSAEDEFFAQFEKDAMPKIRDSAFGAAVWTGKIDPKLALEVGAMLLLGKPLILMVTPGAKVPGRLAEVADDIVEIDVENSDRTAARLQAAMVRVIERSQDAPEAEG